LGLGISKFVVGIDPARVASIVSSLIDECPELAAGDFKLAYREGRPNWTFIPKSRLSAGR
jgi:hypothetical protein